MAESSRVLLDGGYAAVSTSPIIAGTIVPLVFPDTDPTAQLDNNGLEVLDHRISEFSVLSWGTDYMFCDMIVLDGDALGTCASDNGILDGDEGWLCLLYSLRSGNSGNNYVAAGLKYNGMAHCSGLVWNPGPVAGQCIYVCSGCLCVIALFRSVMLLVHDWAVCSIQTGSGIGYYRTNTCEFRCFKTIYVEMRSSSVSSVVQPRLLLILLACWPVWDAVPI